jgi:hypothetical protein
LITGAKASTYLLILSSQEVVVLVLVLKAITGGEVVQIT